MERSELVERLVARDEGAWRVFIDEYGGLMYAVATRLGLDDAAREDLFQEACLRALESIGTLADPTKLASWVYTVTYRLGVDFLRRRRPEIGMEQAGAAAQSLEAGGVEPDIVEKLARLEAVAGLLDALTHLDPRCRRLLAALYLEEPRPSYDEIGRREGMPIGSIGPTRARCLEKTKRLIPTVSNRPPGASSSRSRRRTGREGNPDPGV
jgi:RNA polymerase sigma factor (sigma-70 family)